MDRTLDVYEADRVNTLTILYADDEQSDLALFGIAVDKLDLEVSLRTVSSGEQLLRYLKGEGQYAERAMFPMPDLIVLDLKMMGLGGADVLKWLESSPVPASIPVIVFTGSQNPELHANARRMGARATFEKPVTFSKWQETVQNICELGFKLKAERQPGSPHKPRRTVA